MLGWHGEASAPFVPAEPAGAGDGLDAAWRAPETRRRLVGPGFAHLPRHCRSVEPQRRAAASRTRLSAALHLPQLDEARAHARARYARYRCAAAAFRPVRYSSGAGCALRNPGRAAGLAHGPADHAAFGGQSPIALVTSGTQDGLLLVRRFLMRRAGSTCRPMQPMSLRRRSAMPISSLPDGERALSHPSADPVAISVHRPVRHGGDGGRSRCGAGTDRLDR